MFDKDFYPTPPEVIDLMGVDCHDKVVFEPSAGSGNMIDWCKLHGAREVLSCEKNDKLAEIVKSKSRFLGYDFLKVNPDSISHVHLIIMNPPFSSGVKHVLHAWNIAPGGCEIYSLINQDNLEHDYSMERRELSTLIQDYGQNESLGDVFSDAERKTGVDIGLIKLFKPRGEENEFEGFFMYEDHEQQGTGIMEFNSVRDVVQRYVYSVKKFDEIMSLSAQMSDLNTPFGVGGVCCQIGYKEQVTTKDDYKKELQKKAWAYLFNQMNLNKFVTSGVMRDINKFVENQTKVPFTMKNIYRMFEIIVGTREETFNRSLVEAVDKFTEYTHENRYNVEGWKTNAGHLLNKKIIIPYMVETGWGNSNNLTVKYSGNHDKIEDLVKVLCSVQAENFDKIPRLYNHAQELKMEPNTWYDWGFFEIKGFKKGTMHLKFKDDNVWANINRRYAKIKGQVLPEKI